MTNTTQTETTANLNAWAVLLPYAPESVQIERAVRAKIAAKRAAK